jgi:hypothetical protein
MDFKHKAPPSPQNGNYMDSIHHRSPYNQDSMLHHINAPQKEHFQYQPQQSVYEYNDGSQYNKYQQQNMLVKGHYRSPVSHRLRRRCRSECLSPSRSPQHQYHPERYNLRNGHTNGYQQDMWRMQRRSEDRESPYEYRQQPQHEILGVDGYKFRFNNLQIDGKSVHLEDPIDIVEESYESWNQRRRLRARSESASQDYYYRDEPTQDSSTKTRETLSSPKEKFSRNHSHQNSHHNHHVTNPRANNNYSVLVNNQNHYRYSLSPKTRIRSHHVGHHKIGMNRVASPLQKARLWKNQNSSGSSSLPSTESNTPTSSRANQDEEDEDDDDDDDEEEEPPIPPGSNIIDDDMSDPEDNYESSLSLSSSEISSLAINAKMSMISTDCVLATGRIHQQPLAPSLFPFVPPYITFSTYEDKGPDMPSMIHKILKWKLTTITPLLVRKVLLNTGFRLMKSKKIYLIFFPCCIAVVTF